MPHLFLPSQLFLSLFSSFSLGRLTNDVRVTQCPGDHQVNYVLHHTIPSSPRHRHRRRRPSRLLPSFPVIARNAAASGRTTWRRRGRGRSRRTTVCPVRSVPARGGRGRALLPPDMRGS